MTERGAIALRLTFVYLGLLVFALMIVGRIIYLQFVKFDELSAKAQKFSLHEFSIPAKRGDICAKDGRLLATSVPHYDVHFDGGCKYVSDREFFKHLDEISTGLARIFPSKTQQEFRQQLYHARSKRKRYVLLKRDIDFLQLKRVKSLPIFNMGKNKSGLIVEQTNERITPYNDMASRTIGYLFENDQKQMAGMVGLERAYDRELRGVDGFTMKQKLSGNVWMPINDDNQVESVDGYNIISTIDVDVQDVATSALKRQVLAMGAAHGCAILMEVETGNILAMANVGNDGYGNLREDYNYAIGEATEPGSTFKTASLMVAMEDGYIEPTDTVDCEGGVTLYYKAKMNDSHKGLRRITIQHALEVSSNVGISKVITKYYRGKEDEFVKGLYNLRLNVPLGLEIVGEGIPRIKDPREKSWSGVSLPWMSIGYEVKLTPLQVLTFYNAIANDGKMVKPKFIQDIREGEKIIETRETEVLQPSICSRSTLRNIRAMLEGVVLVGTANNIKNTNYSIAGKTGTAQLNYWDKAKQGKHQASFVGYFPADKPKFSCIVVINAPSKGVYYANIVSGTVFKEIADKVFSTTLEIQPDISEKMAGVKAQAPTAIDGYRDDLQVLVDALEIPLIEKTSQAEWVRTGKIDSALVIKPRDIKDNTVPDVRGMGLRDAVFILENRGLRVVVSGRGTVKTQSVAPGSGVYRGQVISLVLG